MGCVNRGLDYSGFVIYLGLISYKDVKWTYRIGFTEKWDYSVPVWYPTGVGKDGGSGTGVIEPKRVKSGDVSVNVPFR